jgi:hypothetical protein
MICPGPDQSNAPTEQVGTNKAGACEHFSIIRTCAKDY